MHATSIPVISKRTATVASYVFAASDEDALRAVLMPADRCPRYRTEADARDAQAFGDDGFPGESLFCVRVEEVSK